MQCQYLNVMSTKETNRTAVNSQFLSSMRANFWRSSDALSEQLQNHIVPADPSSLLRLLAAVICSTWSAAEDCWLWVALVRIRWWLRGYPRSGICIVCGDCLFQSGGLWFWASSLSFLDRFLISWSDKALQSTKSEKLCWWTLLVNSVYFKDGFPGWNTKDWTVLMGKFYWGICTAYISTAATFWLRFCPLQVSENMDTSSTVAGKLCK